MCRPRPSLLAEVWQCIEDHIEPLATLRRTVEFWRDSGSASPWKVEVSENMLLLLDPEVTAEVFPEASGQTSALPYDAPDWKLPAPMCHVCSGQAWCASLEPPPPNMMNLWTATSVTLRGGTAFACWAVDACRVLKQCVFQAQQGPVSLECLGIWSSLPAARAWFESLGFLCEQSGLRTP